MIALCSTISLTACMHDIALLKTADLAQSQKVLIGHQTFPHERVESGHEIIISMKKFCNTFMWYLGCKRKRLHCKATVLM